MPFLLNLFLLATLLACSDEAPAPLAITSQGCEGCEAVYESPVPLEKLSSVDTLPGFAGSQRPLYISGTVYTKDRGSTVPGVVLYFYHTNQAGIYPTRGDEKGWGKRHGYLRGWVRTDPQGRYGFYTSRPASYPNSTAPAHIHMIVKQPGAGEYWIDDILFDDDPNLTERERARQRGLGGSGIVKTEKKNGMEVGLRDVYLEK